jgi:hypothetical protein
MRRVSKADIKENSELYKGCIFLEPREWMDNAISGKCINTGGIIYDYDTLLEAYMVKDGITYDQASQVVDFNTERAIPYMPEPRPVVQKEEIDIDSEDYDEDDID